ncbi:MAG: (Fe-S)-binding protein [Propionibacteriaceae bacterium]|jgi:L-lactate dehydrogenase complex protein LldE|nr:(Fe-S)-binding protein [Propionibacteriaceae bacterium]
MSTSSDKTVALFATCISDLMFPNTPKAVVALLERLGCRVEFPSAQTCCGQMFTNTGYYREALGSVRAYVRAFGKYEHIVAPSGSCVGSVREQHPMLAASSRDKGLRREVEAVVARTWDITEFLTDVLEVEDVGAYFPHKVTYHPTCHSVRVAKIGDRPYRLLNKVRGLTLLNLEDSDQCCGFGGTFSIKNPDLSTAMATAKARQATNSGAEYLVAADNACLMNIGGVLSRGRSGVKTIHLAEILATTEPEE